jgi:hypothetical protein
MSKATKSFIPEANSPHDLRAKIYLVSLEATAITGITMEKRRIGSITSRDLVFRDMAENRVPTAANPTVPKKITTVSWGRTLKMGKLNNTKKTARVIASTITIKKMLPRVFPQYMTVGSTGHMRRPLRQSLFFSVTKDRVKPSTPAKMKVIHKMPGAISFMYLLPGSITKLKIKITRMEKTIIDERTSFVFASRRISFHRIAIIPLRYLILLPFQSIVDTCAGALQTLLNLFE